MRVLRVNTLGNAGYLQPIRFATTFTGPVTELLQAWSGGDDSALEQMIHVVEASARRRSRVMGGSVAGTPLR